MPAECNFVQGKYFLNYKNNGIIWSL
jgi:hypothetical protein